MFEDELVSVIDSVSISSIEGVSFTLTGISSGVVDMQSYEASAGTLAEVNGSLVWQVPENVGKVDTTYTLTTTYKIDDSTLLEGMIVESLDVLKGVPETDRMIKFEVHARVEKLAPSIASKDRTISYELMISSLYLLDAFTVTDTIPAGVSYAGNLLETDGFAIYDSGSDNVVWKAPENAVGDPSFEDGTDWAECGSIAGPTCSPGWCRLDAAYSGIYYLWFGGWSTTNMAFIAQDVVVPVADEATLTFWMAIVADAAEDKIDLIVSLDGQQVASFSEHDVASYEDYTLVTLDVSEFADGNSHLLMLQSFEVGITKSSIFVDDVSLAAGTPINSKNISASFDVLVEGDVGTSVTNVAEFEFVGKKLEAEAVTDIMTIIYMPVYTRNYTSP